MSNWNGTDGQPLGPDGQLVAQDVDQPSLDTQSQAADVREAAERLRARVAAWDRLDGNNDRSTYAAHGEAMRHDAMSLICDVLAPSTTTPSPITGEASPVAEGRALERIVHANGPVCIDWMGEQLAWRPLDYGTWTALSATAPQQGKAGVDHEDAAWNWLESKWLSVEAGHDPNDRTYSADEMVDAFMAGLAQSPAPDAPPSHEERVEYEERILAAEMDATRLRRQLSHMGQYHPGDEA